MQILFTILSIVFFTSFIIFSADITNCVLKYKRFFAKIPIVWYILTLSLSFIAMCVFMILYYYLKNAEDLLQAFQYICEAIIGAEFVNSSVLASKYDKSFWSQNDKKVKVKHFIFELCYLVILGVCGMLVINNIAGKFVLLGIVSVIAIYRIIRYALYFTNVNKNQNHEEDRENDYLK